MFNPDLNSPLNRTVFIVLGLMIVGLGVLSLQHVGLVYRNWRRELVFGPFAIAFGVLFIAAMLKLGSKSANKTAFSIRSKRPKRPF